MLKTKTMVCPTAGRILVRRDAPEDRSQGGILIPQSAKERPRRGTVEAVGPARITDEGARIEPTIAKGDRVVFSAYGGIEIEDDVLILAEGDVLAVLK